MLLLVLRGRRGGCRWWRGFGRWDVFFRVRVGSGFTDVEAFGLMQVFGFSEMKCSCDVASVVYVEFRLGLDGIRKKLGLVTAAGDKGIHICY